MAQSGADVATGISDDLSTTDTIVIDTGSCLTKVGYSGEDSPRTRFSTLVGTNTEKRDAANAKAAALAAGAGSSGSGAASSPKPSAGAESDDEDKLIYAGDSVLGRRDSLALTKPVQRTVVQDWDALEALWEWTFTDELNVDPEAFPVLLMDSVLENKKSRETMAKIMFEKFNVKSFYVATQSVLSLFSSGVTSGLVLECGDEISRAVPVFEGFALRHAVSTTKLASRNCYSHFGASLQAANVKHKLVVDMLDFSCLPNQLYEKHACVDIDGTNYGQAPEEEAFHELPDGSIIHVPYSVCATSGEVLFNPALAGLRDQSSVTDIVLKSFDLCDNDLKKQFKTKLSVSGGTAMLNGFAPRIEAELRTSDHELSQVKVKAESNLVDSSWVGGSMLASLSTFSYMRIRKQEYEDSHAAIVHRKCL